MSKFEDSQFEQAHRELENPQIDGWELFLKSHDVTIYRLYTELSGLYKYKIYGYMNDVLPEVCAKVYMDLDYRKQWDSYVKELYETDVHRKKLIYWNINYPFFMSNRDYVYQRELRELDYFGKKIWVILAQSCVSPDIPEKPGVIRVDDYTQCAALTTDGKQGTKAFMHYYDNPKGMIPTWFINWGAKTGVPQFLTVMQTACRGYPAYLKQQQDNLKQHQDNS